LKRYTLSVFAALAAIAVIPFVAAQSPATVVRMTGDKSFEPKTITVKPGDTVVWKNVSDMVHTVTDIPAQAITKGDAVLPPNAKEFDSGLIQPGKDYSYTFTVPGTYKYFCVPHETAGMVGIGKPLVDQTSELPTRKRDSRCHPRSCLQRGWSPRTS
jgi:plastocyanin